VEAQVYRWKEIMIDVVVLYFYIYTTNSTWYVACEFLS